MTSRILFIRRSLTALFLAVLAAAGPAAIAGEESYVPDRRKTQFPNEPGYYLFPMPYSIPGIGQGLGVMGFAVNVGGSYTDVFGFALGGSLPGYGVGVSDVHIVPRTVIADLASIQFGSSSIPIYSQRGMETDKHDFSYYQFDHYGFHGMRLTTTFADRKFEVYGGGYLIGAQPDKVLDQNGNTLQEIPNAPTLRTKMYGVGIRTDLTDDYYDPRRGLRLDAGRWWSPPTSMSAPDFYRMEYSASAYFPLGKRSTWAFNYFRSDAKVTRQGETDPLKIEQDRDLNCSTQTGQDKVRCDQIVQNIIAENTYGTATGLGGTSRLRSYPENRYTGAHTVFYGTEVRWTLTEEAHPFDIFIAKDIRTVLQVALFYEMGSVEDRRDDLGRLYRPSYGAGFRMITASGIVIRGDFASGREGVETTIIFGYPWESF